MSAEEGKRYHEYFSWMHRIGDRVLAHTSGAISTFISIKGIDTSFKSLADLRDAYAVVAAELKALPRNVLVEWHMWREYDDSKSKAYLDQQHSVVRGHQVSAMVRTALADHLKQFTMTNHVGIVVTLQPENNPIKHFRRLTNHAFREKEQESRVPDLLKIAEKLAFKLNGQVEKVERFSEAIQRSYHRDHFYRGQDLSFDLSDRFQWNEQLITVKPDYLKEAGVLKVNQSFTWVGIMKVTPEYVHANWGDSLIAMLRGGRLGNGEIDVHISFITTPANARKSASKSEKDSRDANRLRHSMGGIFNAKRADDAQGFAQDVADNQMGVLSNMWVIHIHSKDLQRLQGRVEEIREQLGRANAMLASSEEITWAYWRVGMPGQGHWNRFWRTHSHRYCAYMVPCVKFNRGSDEVTSLRMTALGEAISLHHNKDKASHTSIIGKTGSGKGAIKALEIIETASKGVDWYIIEKGTTHIMTVAALGGTYIKVDPSKHVINPLPTYAEMDNAEHRGEGFENYISGFIAAIDFTLVGAKGFKGIPANRVEHYKAVAETALLDLYNPAANGDNRRETALSPNLGDYLVSLKTLDDVECTPNEDQRDAAREMASHLESFLSRSRGRVFLGDTNLNIKPGVVGLDFSLVENEKDLAAAMLAFACIRIGNYAYFGTNPARVLLEECHAFSDDQTVVELAKNIATMGRKNSCSIEVSGQSHKQFEGFKELEAQLCMRAHFYVADSHETVAERAQMPVRALATWKSYIDPDNISRAQQYRDMLLGYNGTWFELVIALPPLLLEWVNTNDQATMQARERIVFDMQKEAVAEYREEQKALAEVQGEQYQRETDARILSKVSFELDPYEMLRRLRAWESEQAKPTSSSQPKKSTYRMLGQEAFA